VARAGDHLLFLGFKPSEMGQLLVFASGCMPSEGFYAVLCSLMDWILEPWLCISLMLFCMLANIMAESSCYDRNSGCQQWVVMAAHPCYSWWWWRSDILWASLIRLWLHSILSCLQSVCCEVFLQIFLQS
jgi:hypothetical protein